MLLFFNVFSYKHNSSTTTFLFPSGKLCKCIEAWIWETTCGRYIFFFSVWGTQNKIKRREGQARQLKRPTAFHDALLQNTEKNRKKRGHSPNKHKLKNVSLHSWLPQICTTTHTIQTELKKLHVYRSQFPPSLIKNNHLQKNPASSSSRLTWQSAFSIYCSIKIVAANFSSKATVCS